MKKEGRISLARSKQLNDLHSKNIAHHNHKRLLWRKYLKKLPIEKRGHSLQRILNENEARHVQYSHVLPENLSIIENPEDVISSFNSMEQIVSQGFPIYLDMKNIKKLSIESIMYMLSLIKNLKHREVPFHIRGNAPSTAENYHLLQDSGFFSFVGNNVMNLKNNGDLFEINESAIVDNAVGRKICQFVMSKMGVEQKRVHTLYDMIIELMTNTIEHAYGTGVSTVSHWYIYIHYEETKKAMHFAFLDNGLGIPTTVQKSNWEKFQKWIADKELLVYGQVDLIEASLHGAFKTRTQEENRGKGMPGIYDSLMSRKINDLVIISNNGYFSQKRKMDMSSSMRGTLYYWTMRKECFYAGI
jgi:hypothetical protein